jgi:hypothetical protein
MGRRDLLNPIVDVLERQISSGCDIGTALGDRLAAPPVISRVRRIFNLPGWRPISHWSILIMKENKDIVS